MTDEKTFWVRSMFGAESRQPIVVVTMPGGESVQMSPEDARSLAGNLLAGAEAAEGDGFFVDFLSNAGVDEERQAAMLAAFRDYREKRRTSSD